MGYACAKKSAVIAEGHNMDAPYEPPLPIGFC